jgi:transposase-like protein
VFILADRGTGDCYVIPAKAADESTIRLLFADRKEESLTVYTDGFRAYEPLDEDDAFDREYVVHGDGEYAMETLTSLPARAIEGSPRASSRCISEPFSFVVVSTENQGKRRSKSSSKLRYESPTVSATRAMGVY